MLDNASSFKTILIGNTAEAGEFKINPVDLRYFLRARAAFNPSFTHTKTFGPPSPRAMIHHCTTTLCGAELSVFKEGRNPSI